MDFNKIINDMKTLQEKVDTYDLKEKKIQEAITSIIRDISKLEKKIEKENDDVNKAVLNLKIKMMKDISNRFIFENND